MKSSKQATRYAANRKGEEQNRGGREIYDRDGAISKDDAYRRIETADQGGDKYHYRLTLSHAQTGEGVDHNATTRETMQRLEERHAAQGGAVMWHAVNHMDHTRHEHTHVIAVTDRRIGTADFANMRAELDRSYERHTPRDIERVEQSRPQEQRQEVQVQATPEPQRGEVQTTPESQRPQAEPAQEERETQQGQTPEPGAEQPERKKPQRQLELDWIYTEEQQRDERYLAERPSLITSGEAARDFDHYKQLQTTVAPSDHLELSIREQEWFREQQAAGNRPEMNEAYREEQRAVVRDLNGSQHMPEADRQRHMDRQADGRWQHRAVNDRNLWGEDLGQAYRDRREAREQDRINQNPSERRELSMREREWQREQGVATGRPGPTESYRQDHSAALQDLQNARHLPREDRQRVMDRQADDRWMHRAVNEQGFRGDELGQAYRERTEARRDERTIQNPFERQELSMREREWQREQGATGQRPERSAAYQQEYSAVLEDMRQSKEMTQDGRQRYMDRQADDRWQHRAVNDRNLWGEDLAQAHRERHEARKEERAAQEPQRQTRWGEDRRQHNAEQAQRYERQAQAWAERPARTSRQQQRQDRQQDQSQGGRER